MLTGLHMKILIVKFGALGDVVRTSYVLPFLHDKYENTEISWLTAESSFDLLRFNPYIYRLATPSFGFDSLQRVVFDLVLSFDDESHILDIVGQVATKKLIGAYKVNGTCTYSDDSSEWFDMGLISRYGNARADELKKSNCREHNQIFGDMLGITISHPSFYYSSYLNEKAAQFFDKSYFNIGINSGSGARWESKQLPLEETISLVNSLLSLHIQRKRVRVYLLGGREEFERHKAIKMRVSSKQLLDAGTENSILEFAAIIRQCDYIITSDSLALHLAISQGIKNLSFYAPTSAAEIGTFGTGAKVISLSGDYCSYRKDADTSTITADRILEAFTSHVHK